MKLIFFVLLSGVRSQEFSTPSSILQPRNFNHHAYQYLEETGPEPTKQGPVLFPNDAPPPPKPPLIVTSRPLSESIARSELNPENNTIGASSQIKPEFRLKPQFLKPSFRLKPEYRPKGQFLARVKDYTPFVLSTPLPEHYEPYEDVKENLNGLDNRHNDYEGHTVLPPIYKAFADHAKQKVLKLKHKHPGSTPSAHYDYQDGYEPTVSQRYQHNDVRDDGEADYDHGSNYAFSYRVKDHKTGDDFSHSQHSSGSATNGEYRVRLPDGRMQIVSYTADENGYKADVRYDDEEKTAGNSIDHNNNYDYRPTYDYDNKYRNANLNNKHIPATNRAFTVNNYDYTVKNHVYTGNNRDYTVNNPDYKLNNNYVQNRDYKVVSSTYNPPPVHEEYNQYSDLSKEYNTDYSLEYDGKDDNYGPHKSKFSSFIPKGSNLGTIVVPNVNHNSVSSTTVRPSYEELKPLFVTKNLYPTQSYLNNIELNVPSTTPSSIDFGGTTEHVVIIGTPKPNLYTNVRNVPLTVTPPVTETPSISSNFVTPRNYLVSTIANLKNGQKPILSGSFIDRINKYLTFT